jgi:hypothetical protein
MYLFCLQIFSSVDYPRINRVNKLGLPGEALTLIIFNIQNTNANNGIRVVPFCGMLNVLRDVPTRGQQLCVSSISRSAGAAYRCSPTTTREEEV